MTSVFCARTAPLAPVTPTVTICFCVSAMFSARIEFSLAAALRQVKLRPHALCNDRILLRSNNMNQQELLKILELVKSGELAPAKAIERLKHLPFEDLGFAKVDHHRALRQGFAEVIFGKGKTPAAGCGDRSRDAAAERFAAKHLGDARGCEDFRGGEAACSRGRRNSTRSPASSPSSASQEITGKGTILVVSAGTSDIPVAEEALLTARIMGNRAEHLYDVGVAGIHRLLEHREKLTQAPRDYLRRRNGRRAAERCGRPGRGAGDCGSHQRRLRREFWRRRCAAGHAQLLRVERDRREHRQRFRRGLRGVVHQPSLEAVRVFQAFSRTFITPGRWAKRMVDWASGQRERAGDQRRRIDFAGTE